MRDSEVLITNNANEIEFERIGNFISHELNGVLTNKLDGLEQRYWDFKIDDVIITLHWEQYIGITVFGDKPEKAKIFLNQIKSKFSNKNE